MALGANADQIAAVVDRLQAIGAQAHVSEGQSRTVIGAVGDRGLIQQLPWEAMDGVERAVPVLKEFKFVSREFQAEDPPGPELEEPGQPLVSRARLPYRRGRPLPRHQRRCDRLP